MLESMHRANECTCLISDMTQPKHCRSVQCFRARLKQNGVQITSCRYSAYKTALVPSVGQPPMGSNLSLSLSSEAATIAAVGIRAELTAHADYIILYSVKSCLY